MATIHSDLLGSETIYLDDEFRTRAIIAGEGETLLMMHGIGGHAEAYSRNIRRLSEHYRVVAFDFVWHGLSAKPEFVGESIPTYVKQVLGVMDALGEESVHLEGESLGGWVGLCTALRHADRVKSLILNTSAGVLFDDTPADQDVAAAQAALRDRSLKVLDDPSRDHVRARLEWLMAEPDRVTEELIDLRQAFYTDPATNQALRDVFSHRFSVDGRVAYHLREADLADVSVPTLVLWSGHNPGHGPAFGRRLADLIPGAAYRQIDDAAHWPQWEQPVEHDAHVLDFLGRL